jgi:isocitrate dehydrogenase
MVACTPWACIYSCIQIYRSFLPSSQVTLIPGDGIGQEITESVKEIFESVNAPIEWDQYDVSGMSSSGEALFKQAMESLKRNKVGLKGLLFIHSFTSLHGTIIAKASCSLQSQSPVTYPGMWPCVNSSTFTPL